MNFRKATIMDEEGIVKLLFELLNVDNLEEARQTFLREVNKGDKYIVAEEDGEIIGLVSYILHGRPKHGLAELYHIVVSKEARGKGIGKQLFNASVEELKKEYEKKGSKLRKLFVLTRGTNITAHAFYEKMGFEHEATLKEHFYKGEDEFVYSVFF